MKIIDRIEIHRFRSIGDESIIASDINIYSGVNNSGKSNILRALNLFFKQETNYDSPYDHEKDYNKAFTGQAGGAREIRITLHFAGQGEGALSDPFSITRAFRYERTDFQTIYSSSNIETQSRIDANDGKVTRQFTRFLNSIKYFYIPAVRDKRFVRHLFLNFEQIVTDKKGEDLEERLRDLSDIISRRSEAISEDFEQFLKLPTKAVLSSELSDILGSIKVNVDSGLQVRRGSKKKGSNTEIVPVFVDLFSSGDGVLMSYLAYFLAHLCRETPNVRYIWGFEEPENSLEYSKVQKLADEFSNKFNRYAQLFITTHSPAFVNLKNRQNVSFYRAYIEPNSDLGKPDKRLTRIRTLDTIEQLQLSLLGQEDRRSELELLSKELGMVEFSLEIERAAEEFQRAKEDQNTVTAKLRQELDALKDTYPDKILIIEDSASTTASLWQNLLDKYGVTNVKILSSGGCTKNNIEEHILQLQSNRPAYKPKVFRQVDRDGLLDDQVSYIERQLNKIVDNKFTYKLTVLPVNEVENFAIIDNQVVESIKSEHSEYLRNKFDNTAEQTLSGLHRKYRNAPEKMFRGSTSYNSVIQKMRSKAIEDWSRFMPGKDICSKMQGFDAISVLQSLDKLDHPSELSAYMNEIKTFFEDSNND